MSTWIFLALASLFILSQSREQKSADWYKAAESKPASADPGLVACETKESIALMAMDRQCGNCHQESRSENKAALTIFNLADSCWYCKLTPSRAKSLVGRIQSKTFSNEEREAITALMEKLAAQASK